MDSVRKLKKALNVPNILNQKIKLINFTGAMHEAFSTPQDKGVWFCWGGSGSGKSSFIMQLCKEFCLNGLPAIHNLLEEETDDKDYIDRVRYLEMNDVKENYLAVSLQYEDFVAYLKKNKKVKVVVIDSGIYFFKNFEQYLEFKKTFKDKIILITGHAQGSNPRTELEKSIMYDARQKIFVDGYQASCKGRTIGPNGGFYTIWKQGYEKIHGSQTN